MISIFFRTLLTFLLLLPVPAAHAYTAQGDIERDIDRDVEGDVEGFADFLAGVKAEAAANGISPRAIAALNNVMFEPSVIELDQKQPEKRLTFTEYLERTVTAKRIQQGQEKLAEHYDILQEIGARYGVQPRFIVALWGKETDYGGFKGNSSVLDSLATLAYEGRRADFFKQELITALKIIDAGYIGAEDMIGSWAGAMGHCQFMPSSYLRYGADGDGDGKIDLWHSLPDVFASIANYLRSEGWNADLTWGRAVQVPAGFANEGTAWRNFKPLTEWAAQGVRRADGKPLPNLPLMAGLVQPDGASGPSFIVYDNYRVLMHWNRSLYFATAIGQLADAIGD